MEGAEVADERRVRASAVEAAPGRASTARGRPDVTAILRRLSRGLWAATRVGCWGALVFAALAMLFAGRARAGLGDELRVLGRNLARFEDLTGETQVVRVNGQTAFFASSSTSESVGEVLLRFSVGCEEASPLRAQAAPLGPKQDPVVLSRLGVLRSEGEHEGTVACLVSRTPSGTLLEGLQRFAASLELSGVGELRYAYARAKPAGGTQVVTVWTEGPFHLGAMMVGEQGDLPGEDPAGVPRPAEARRLLAAELAGTPFGAWVYDVAAPVATVLARLDIALEETEWQRVPGTDELVPGARVYARAHEELFVAAGARGGRTALALGRSASAPGRSGAPAQAAPFGELP